MLESKHYFCLCHIFFFNINNTEKMKKKSVLVIDGKINIYFFSNFNRNLRQYKIIVN